MGGPPGLRWSMRRHQPTVPDDGQRWMRHTNQHGEDGLELTILWTCVFVCLSLSLVESPLLSSPLIGFFSFPLRC